MQADPGLAARSLAGRAVDGGRGRVGGLGWWRWLWGVGRLLKESQRYSARGLAIPIGVGYSSVVERATGTKGTSQAAAMRSAPPGQPAANGSEWVPRDSG